MYVGNTPVLTIYMHIDRTLDNVTMEGRIVRGRAEILYLPNQNRCSQIFDVTNMNRGSKYLLSISSVDSPIFFKRFSENDFIFFSSSTTASSDFFLCLSIKLVVDSTTGNRYGSLLRSTLTNTD